MKLASNASLALMASTNCPNGHRGTPEELITNATNAEHHRVLSELEHLLQATGCPACRYIEGIERSFFSWFQIESFSIAEMQGRLRAAMGMCAAHLRRLIEQIGEGHIITIVMREAVAGARQHLSGETPLGRCPACEASSVATQRAIELLLDGLREPRHARLYQEHAGVCVQHFLEASRVAEPSDLKVPAERLHESVSEAINHRLIGLLAGSDGDALSRRRWRHELPDDRADGSTLERLGGLLANEACPLCLSVGRIERSYLEWFLERCREHDPAIQTEPGELCSDHLNDAAIADEAVAAEAAQGKRRARLSELQRVLDCLSALPPTARRARRARSEELDRALAELCTARYCPACHARSEIEHSQLSLVLASLAIPSVRERYLGSHGLCARHAIKAGEGQAARVIKLHADARLNLLGWELAETARKRAWACRNETVGPERDAWLRAAAQVDGRVFEGCPALVPLSSSPPL